MRILNDIAAKLESETAHHKYRPRVKKGDRSDDRSPSWRALANASSSIGRSNEFERWSFDGMSYELTRRIGSEISGAFRASGAFGGAFGTTGTGGAFSAGTGGTACSGAA